MIAAMTISIAILGILLLGILCLRIRAVNDMVGLKQFRSKEAGFSDLLNFAAMVEDGVIVGKNGSFTAAWIYEGEDNASSTDEYRERVSALINRALSGMGSGWMIHIDAVRRPSPTYMEKGRSHFPDRVSAAVDEERRRLFERIGTMYEGFFVFTVTYLPPLVAEKKFVDMMFDDDAVPENHREMTQALIDHFKRECMNIESRLSTAVKMTRLRGRQVMNEDGSTVTHDDFLRWLQFCATGLNHPVILPRNPMYLDMVIGNQEMWKGTTAKIGLNFVKVVAIDGFPLESTPGILTALGEQPCEYRWSSRFIFMDSHEALAHMEKFRKKWKQKIRGFFDQVFNTSSGSIDHDAVSMVSDAEAALADVNSGLVAQGYYTSVVILMDEDRKKVETSALALRKAIQRTGFGARVETVNTVDAFFGSLPSHGVENVRRPLINTMNLADFLPTSTIWTGTNFAPCPMYPAGSPPLMHCVTQGSTPFRFNLHVRDLGHTLMFGPTRSGKSTHLGLIVMQMLRYEGMSVYAFDKGMSMYATTKAAGGTHYSVGSDDSTLAFCPLQFLETPGDKAWALEWIDTVLALNGLVTTPVQRTAISNAIVTMHNNGQKTLSDFVNVIQSQLIRETLAAYTVAGLMGHLLDAETDNFELSKFTTIELEELLGLGQKYALPVLLYLFRRIERSLVGQPAAIILDEAWIMLDHPVFRDKIRDWLKSFAKKNCLVLLATQSLSDAAKSGIFDVIVESTATKIFLGNPYACDDEPAALYSRMGLNKRQREILAQAIPQRQYYCVSEAGRRLYELALGPLALAFVGATDKDSIAAIKNLEARYGDVWVDHWLATKNLKLNDFGGTA